MPRFLLLTWIVLTTGCGAHRESATDIRLHHLDAGEDNRLANLERAARYPWKDDGRCAVQESSGDWAALVEECYHTLDRSRIRFVDHKGVCPVAQAGAMSADDLARLVGICILVQPELVVGAVIVVGAFVVAAALSAEIEAARTRKPGCYCKCLKAGIGPDPRFGRVASPAVCAGFCANHPDGPRGWTCK